MLLFILRYIFTFSLGGHTSLQWTSFSCFLFEFSLETTPQIFHTASNWLTLALAVQRYIYVCHAPLAKRFCTVPRARITVFCLLGLAILHMVPRVFDRVYSIEYVEYPICSGIHSSVCMVHFSSWTKTITIDLYFMIFFWYVM